MGSDKARCRLKPAVGASADGLVAQQPGERMGSRPQPPKAGARSASLEPGRSPGYLPTIQLLHFAALRAASVGMTESRTKRDSPTQAGEGI